MTNNNKPWENIPLDTKCTEMFGNVQLGKYYTQDLVQVRKDFDNVFSNIKYVDSYFFIVHDDSDFLHVHFILLLSCQVRLITLINKLSESLNVDTTAISNTKLKSIVGALRYIIHITDESREEGKKEYSPLEILSNESDLIVKGYLDSDSDDNISLRFLRDLVIHCDIKSDIYLKINNTKLLKKNRMFIDTFWEDKIELRLREKDYDNLPW